jgi:tetratricopeptide (TPR) repeat protein
MGQRQKKRQLQKAVDPGRRDRLSDSPASRVMNRFAVVTVCGLLLLAVLVVFGQTIAFDFVNFDDGEYVSDNPHVTHGLTSQSVAWAFTTVRCNNWHPLTWLSYMLDSQLYGLNPWGYHLTNVLLHAATAIALFLVLRRMTGDFWPSAFVAAVFAVHPLRVESVAWVAERKDVLSGLFFMLTLSAYASYVRRPFSWGRYLLVAALFALGLMAKPMLVTLPFVLLLLDYWPLERMALGWWRLVAEKLPLMALSAASCLITPLAQGEAIKRMDVIPLSARITNALVSYVSYVGQLFYPAGLAVLYPHQENRLPAWQFAGALMLLACISVGVWVWRRKYPYLLVGWCWYVGMLVPVIGLVQVGGQSMADRYTYLPQIGLVVALAWGAKRICARWAHRGWLLGGTSALALAALMGCAYHQTSFWFDGETLWRRAIDCTLPNAIAHTDLGTILTQRGQLDEAMAEFQKALEIEPDYEHAHRNLGALLASVGRLDEGIGHLRKALEINPNYSDAHNNLGIALRDQGNIDAAIAEFRKALESNLDNTAAYNNLATVLLSLGRVDEAVVLYRKALAIDPQMAEFHYSLAKALAKQGKLDEAAAEFDRTLAITPDNAETHNNLAAALAMRGRLDEAIVHFQAALKIKPNYPNAHKNLDLAQAQWQDILKSLAGRRALLRSRPNDVALRNDIAWTLATNPNASIRNGAEAVELAERAVQLSGEQEPAALGTLAAAYAEARRFSEALQTARKAAELAARHDDPSLVESLKAEISLYEARTPFRAMPRPAPAGSTQP